MSSASILTADFQQVNRVPFDAPWKWLSAGWRDMWLVPSVSLAYGAIFTLTSLLISFGLYLIGALSLILPLAGGFLLLGPMFAVGLYEASRQLGEEHKTPQLGDMLRFGIKSPGQLAFMGVFLLIIYFVWLEIAFLLFMLYLGPQSMQFENIMPVLLFTGGGLGLLITGTAAGAVLALTIFAITAVSIPLLMRRKIDAVTAAMMSIRAVAVNPQAMLLWAVLIAGMTGFAFVTLYVGLVVVFPLVGHATWHAYRDLVPQLPKTKTA